MSCCDARGVILVGRVWGCRPWVTGSCTQWRNGVDGIPVLISVSFYCVSPSKLCSADFFLFLFFPFWSPSTLVERKILQDFKLISCSTPGCVSSRVDPTVGSIPAELRPWTLVRNRIILSWLSHMTPPSKKSVLMHIWDNQIWHPLKRKHLKRGGKEGRERGGGGGASQIRTFCSLCLERFWRKWSTMNREVINESAIDPDSRQSMLCIYIHTPVGYRPWQQAKHVTYSRLKKRKPLIALGSHLGRVPNFCLRSTPLWNKIMPWWPLEVLSNLCRPRISEV